MEKFIPKVKLRANQLPVWYTPDLRHRCKCLRTLRRKCKIIPTPRNLERLERYEAAFQLASEKAKTKYELGLVSKFSNSNNSIFKIINFLRNGGTVPTLVYHGTTSAATDRDKASLFNKYFHTVLTKSNYSLPSDNHSPDRSSLIHNNMVVTESKVFEVLSSLNPSKAMGIDGIGPRIAPYICESIARDIFLGILYGYKMLLQIFAIVLAFAICKVKIKGLDDAKYIGATIYVTSIVLAVTILATYSLKDVINGFAALICTGFLVGTTVILGLVFMPQVILLYIQWDKEMFALKCVYVAT